MLEAAKEDYNKRTQVQDPEELQAGRLELEAHILIANGKIAKGLKKFSTASIAQRALRYTEPPYYPRPVSIAHATVALKYRKYKESKQAFREALDEIPNWTRAEQGNKVVTAASAQPTEAPSKASLKNKKRRTLGGRCSSPGQCHSPSKTKGPDQDLCS